MAIMERTVRKAETVKASEIVYTDIPKHDLRPRSVQKRIKRQKNEEFIYREEKWSKSVRAPPKNWNVVYVMYTYILIQRPNS